MSRIGKKEINIPAGIEVKINNQIIEVKGPKGSLSQEIHPNVKVAIDDNSIKVTVVDESIKMNRALWGLFGSLISNMVIGVTQGFEKKLEVNGVGYKVSVSGNKLVLSLGFSHTIEHVIPDGISATVEKNLITISGIDKQQVGQVAAQIRAYKKPEPYLGKGIKYIDEVIRRKVGKAAKSA